MCWLIKPRCPDQASAKSSRIYSSADQWPLCSVTRSFQHYLRQEGNAAGRAEFVGILESHLSDRGFRSDMEQLLRVGLKYDPREAGEHIKAKLLSLLPA